MASTGEISERAQTGFSKSNAYDQHRPTYTASIVQLLLEELGVDGKKGAKILDLAAGTGKFTEALAARDEQFQIVAVEPQGDMRRVLGGKKLNGVTVLEGTGERIPLEDDNVDAVICAQSFHWFANMTALREIHRILRRHGALGMVWNIDDYNSVQNFEPSTAWERKAHELLWTFSDDQPRFRHGEWRKIFDDQIPSLPMRMITAGDQLFSLPLAEREEKYEVRLPKEKVWERFSTLSQIATLKGDERERTYKTVMDAMSGTDVDEDGNVIVHGKTIAVWTTPIPDEGRERLIDVEKPT